MEHIEQATAAPGEVRRVPSRAIKTLRKLAKKDKRRLHKQHVSSVVQSDGPARTV